MLSMITMYGSVPYANAVDSLTSASDTITDSDPGAVATHTFDFTNVTQLEIGEKVVIDLDPLFTGFVQGDITCPTNFGSPTLVDADTVSCDATAQIVAATDMTLVLANVTNPVVNNYRMTITTTNAAGDVDYERAEPMVAIVDNVLMTARVTSTLNFTISGTTTAATVNGAACDVDTSASSTLLDFGTLNVGASTTICQELRVTTNASDGYSVVVFQDDELRNSQGDSINSFIDSPDGTGSTSPHAWVTPTGILDDYDTYGHMGLTSDDPTLTGGDDFGDELYVGFNGYTSANAVEVMHHSSPADGTTIDKGRTLVAYTAEISALQQAGDYETTITYVATPTY